MAAEAALGRWARTEMELPPGIDLSGTVLRRLCSGPCAPIWEFVTRHVRHPRNVKKIRGNLLWYRHLEMEGAGLAQAKEEARGAVSRLRQEVGGAAGGAPGRAREAVLELEAALEAELSRRGAELRRGLELRLMGAEATREGRRLREGRGNLRPPHRPGEAGPQLAAAIAMGMEPEVLASVRAVCRTRAEALESLLEPRPSLEAQELMEAATKRWLREAEAVLSRHPPGAVLWALEHLALDSARRPRPPGGARRRLRSYRPADCDLDADAGLDPAPEAEAPPTVRRLLQECWGAVGGVWGLLPALAARLRPQKLRLARLRQQIHQRLGGDPKSQWAARCRGRGERGWAGPRRHWRRKASSCGGYWEHWEDWESWDSPPRGPTQIRCCPFTGRWSCQSTRPSRGRCAGRRGCARSCGWGRGFGSGRGLPSHAPRWGELWAGPGRSCCPASAWSPPTPGAGSRLGPASRLSSANGGSSRRSGPWSRPRAASPSPIGCSAGPGPPRPWLVPAPSLWPRPPTHRKGGASASPTPEAASAAAIGRDSPCGNKVLERSGRGRGGGVAAVGGVARVGAGLSDTAAAPTTTTTTTCDNVGPTITQLPYGA
ncbi:HAUS augmin-like complex subunit 5 isoform X4 [Grus americana]|uniref:HAUS augmin-like complex subunit 5 isoform X4 n=1 Tax=Grus americana TaxID=9117 RepID=UPI0024078DE0|nr:HAUS augmin-like complex subunit 5 isoform X4 [Grus americana]